MASDDRTRLFIGSDDALEPGVQLNDTYEIDERIASGGMGEVYRAHNIQTGDPVAIKTILPELARNETMFALFRKEATILGRLHHGSIVRYYSFSRDPRLGRPYLAMEYVAGPSLADRIATGPLSPDEVRELFGPVASGLAIAHKAGVIHRDLSPDNIILENGDIASPKIIDFGIARQADGGSATLIGGNFAGKYNYVSPEQLGLAKGEVTARSDLYSLGLVLAAALLGRPLDMQGSHVEVIEKRRSVPDLGAIAPPLRALVEAMLQPDPEQRPASAADVAAWLAETAHPGSGVTTRVPVATSTPPFAGAGSLPPRTSESPFGPTPSASLPPAASEALRLYEATRARSVSPVAEEEETRGGRSRMAIILVALLVVIGLAGAGWAWRSGWIGAAPPAVETAVAPRPTAPPTPPPADPPVAQTTSEPVIPPPAQEAAPSPAPAAPATAAADRCFFAIYGTSGDKDRATVRIRGIGLTKAPFEKIQSVLGRTDSLEPQLDASLIEEPQCPVADFFNAMRSSASWTPMMLSPDDLKAGELLMVTVGNENSDIVDLILVDAGGNVWPLGPLAQSVREGAYEVFDITFKQYEVPMAPAVVIAVVSSTGIRLPPAQPLAMAADYLPALRQQLKTLGGDFQINYAYIKGKQPGQAGR